MSQTATYEIVEHDGGWAYRFRDVFSETYPTHDAALAAARDAAFRQGLPGPDETISWEDGQGRWHEEDEPGEDRPQTEVRG